MTAIEWLIEKIDNEDMGEIPMWVYDYCYDALEMEKDQRFMDYTELIRELNTELYERFGEVEKVFEYSTTGFVDTISFDGVLLWNSEMEVREWIEDKNDYEPFEPFIRRIFNEYLDKMHTLKF